MNYIATKDSFITKLRRELNQRQPLSRPSEIRIHPHTIKMLAWEMLEISPDKEIIEPLHLLGMHVIKDEQVPAGDFKL